MVGFPHLKVSKELSPPQIQSHGKGVIAITENSLIATVLTIAQVLHHAVLIHNE